MINKLARLLRNKGGAQLSEIYSVVELDEPFLDRNKSQKSGKDAEDTTAKAKRAANFRLGKINLGGGPQFTGYG